MPGRLVWQPTALSLRTGARSGEHEACSIERDEVAEPAGVRSAPMNTNSALASIVRSSP